MSNGLHSQKLLENEVNGLLILAHALGVSRPCILEVRDQIDLRIVKLSNFTKNGILSKFDIHCRHSKSNIF